MKSRWTWEVGPSGVSERADRAIGLAIESGAGSWSGDPIPTSRSQVQRLMDEGHVLANGRQLKASAKLRSGMQVEITFPAAALIELEPENRPLEILYQDKDLVVLNKPPGLTVHPSTTQNQGTLVHALLFHVKDLSGIGGKLRPGIVHRIDKDTSGALVVTKTDLAHRKLVETFAKHQIEREYWALCYGSPGSRQKTKIQSTIGRNPKDRKKMISGVKGGRTATTYYELLEEYARPARPPFSSWLKVTLETGRTHQVRVHLTAQGHSLLGDPVYGAPTEKQHKWLELPEDVRSAVKALPGQALHARVLGFKHPITGKTLRFEAEPPIQFRSLMRVLGSYRLRTLSNPVK